MNYVDIGEKIGKKLKDDGIQTSQLRKFLSAVNSVSNKIQNEKEELSENMANEIQYLRVKLAYQAGREDTKKIKCDIKEFGLHYMQNILDKIIKDIGNSKQKFEEFNRLIESIIAYHKFYGGKD